ncbi:MAG: metallophosphoesterase [Verrucomicrobia bacterium]|nr:metallophosphoesterase [Verrucomicrobiota bacterium]
MKNGIGTSRREFLRRSVMVAAGVTAGISASRASGDGSTNAQSTRVLFATDMHLMQDNALRSEDGLIAALQAIDAVRPRPDLVVCGGDLTDPSPGLDYAPAGKLLDRFFDIWNQHITIETHYVFGNHDLVGTKNPAVSRDDPRFGKGLFQKRLDLARLYYSFEKAGWRFVILDDVWPNPDGTYYAEYQADQLAFVQSELQKESSKPTVLACHIPAVSVFPALSGISKLNGSNIETASSLVSRNSKSLTDIIHGSAANVKLVLAGHLHHQERIDSDGITYLNGGAVCGNWWKGANMGCPEGFNVIDLRPDGTFTVEYRSFGWKAG